MKRLRLGSVLRPFQALFDAGAVGGMTDSQLLDRFRGGCGASAEAAFEALVMRHGPMVLRVCRSVLRSPEDVQDAFQATFLVLVHRASSIRGGESVGPWLHGVARRVALRSKSDAIRRRAWELRAAERAETEMTDSIDRFGLHEEIEKLPEKYRAPIVLCYLEGMTHDEAARHLGWPVGTVRSRLARARELLRTRLNRRGEFPAAGAFDGAARGGESSTVVPVPLVLKTVQAASQLSEGITTPSTLVSSTALAIAKEVAVTMARARLKTGAATLMAIALAIPGACYVFQCALAPPSAQAKQNRRSPSMMGANDPTRHDRQQLQGTWTLIAKERSFLPVDPLDGPRLLAPAFIGREVTVSGDRFTAGPGDVKRIRGFVNGGPVARRIMVDHGHDATIVGPGIPIAKFPFADDRAMIWRGGSGRFPAAGPRLPGGHATMDHGHDEPLPPALKYATNGTISLDASVSPKRINLISAERTLRGIYELEGNRLSICVRLSESGDAPSEFGGGGGRGCELLIFKREQAGSLSSGSVSQEGKVSMESSTRDRVGATDEMGWDRKIRAVAKWRAEQIRLSHEASGGSPLTEESLGRMRKVIEDGLTLQFALPDFAEKVAETGGSYESLSMVQADHPNLTSKIGQELRVPKVAFLTRWEEGRILGRCGAGPWELIVDTRDEGQRPEDRTLASSPERGERP